MPNNENIYCIKLEFASWLTGLPGFEVTDSELPGCVNIAIMQANPGDSSAYSSKTSHFPRNIDLYLVHQLFNELEKDQVDLNELRCIGSIFKKYLNLLKQMDIAHVYHIVTPGIMASIFLILFLLLLFSSINRNPIIYVGLTIAIYAIGFWMFSVYSLGKNEQILSGLKDKLIKKINFLKSLSFSLTQPPDYFYFQRSTSVALPSYAEVLREDAAAEIERTSVEPMINLSPNAASFFYLHRADEHHENGDRDNTDSRMQERCYPMEL